MNCLNPTQAWIIGSVISKDGIQSPKITFSFNDAERYFVSKFGLSVGYTIMEESGISMPCGKCVHCQISKRKDMTTRLSNEMFFYGDSCCFITLTYNDENIPTTSYASIKTDGKIVERGINKAPVQTLLPADVQKFLKRLRRHLEYIPKSLRRRVGRDHVDHSIRYFCVGEYGGKTARPHYHILIFGWKPSDLVYHSQRKGNIVYRSAQIEKLWKYGFSTVQPCGIGVSRYCARYVTKKFVNDSKSFEPCQDSFYPEFILQSVRHGGMGALFFDKYHEEILKRGYVTYKTGFTVLKARIPPYYLRRSRKLYTSEWVTLRDARISFFKAHKRKPVDYNELLRMAEKFVYDNKRLTDNDMF